MREIGSEFWEIEVGEMENQLFPKHTEWFISGRSALNFIIEDLLQSHRIKKAWLPSWCCESMILPFLNHGIEVEFYPVYFEQGKLVIDLPLKGEVILVMDYFGYDCLIDTSGFPGVVIRDLTHSIHSCKYTDSDYSFGSIRKWTGIITGGFAISKSTWKRKVSIAPADETFVELKKSAMNAKAEYIKGITDDKSYLQVYSQAEDLLEEAGIEAATQEDMINAQRLNISKIAEKRRKNADFIMHELRDFLIFDQRLEGDCPLFVPILFENRDSLRKFLIENRVYCPIHWPISRYHKLNVRTEEIYKKELSLICDQRYDLEHMEHMVALIKKGMELC